MTIPFKLLHAAFSGSTVDLTQGVFEMLFIAGAEPDLSDTGWEFEADLTAAGATILHRQAVPTVTFVGRTLDGLDFAVADPGGATPATHAVLVHQEVGGNRIIAVEDIADHAFDGVNDTFQFGATGIWRMGPAAVPLVLASDATPIPVGTGGTWSVDLAAGGQPGAIWWALVGGAPEAPEYTPATDPLAYDGSGGTYDAFTPLFVYPDARSYTFALLYEGTPILTINRDSI
jgi:hypothetical protein